MKKNCVICGQLYFKGSFTSLTAWRKSKYCSRPCMYKSKIGNKNRLGISYPAWNKGVPSPKGEENPSWKGDKAGYSAKHKWIESILGKPETCEYCGRTGLKKQQIHWANIDHKYKRNLKDWIRLCAKCHINYDKINNF